MANSEIATRLKETLRAYKKSTKTGEDLQFSPEKQAVNNAIRAALTALPDRDPMDHEKMHSEFGSQNDKGSADQGAPFIAAVNELIAEVEGQVTVEPNYFMANTEPPELGVVPIWCKCGHSDAVHYALSYIDEATNELVTGPAKCQNVECSCQQLRPKRRKNRIKHFFTGRG